MKKKLMMALSLVLVAAMSIGGTIAYLTSTTALVNNTFTVGDVAITLDESKVNDMGEKVANAAPVTTNTYKLIPGHTYTKDPTIHVGEVSEDCWIFVKVENGISQIEDAEGNTIADQMTANGWTAVDNAANVFAYKEIVSAEEDILVFGSFTLDGAKAVSGFEKAAITIVGYAVQADGFETAAEAWENAPATWPTAS